MKLQYMVLNFYPLLLARDFFQLTLKEGLTVFRDQEFSMDIHSRPVYRIKQAIYMRNV